jgi:hypothetical protein
MLKTTQGRASDGERICTEKAKKHTIKSQVVVETQSLKAD